MFTRHPLLIPAVGNVRLDSPFFRILERMSVFHDEIEIEDFEYDEDTETYYFPCPCGDKFAITKVSED